jgi:hypothetical protein
MQPWTSSFTRVTSPRGWSLAAIVAVALTAGACRQSSSPEAERSGGEGVYVLRTVADAPLPAVVVDNGYVVVRFVADTLRLNPDGTGVQVIVQRARSPDPETPEAEERWVAPLEYTLNGDRIEVSLVCPPNALMLCAAPPHYRGTVTPTGLRLERALEYRVPFVYERVDE